MSERSKGSNVNISLVESGTIVTGHKIVSNVFNDYFVDVTTCVEADQAVGDSVTLCANNYCSAEGDMSFKMDCPEVRKSLSGLDTWKATGHDGFQPKPTCTDTIYQNNLEHQLTL